MVVLIIYDVIQTVNICNQIWVHCRYRREGFRNQEAEQDIAILEIEKVGLVSWNGRLSLLFRKIKIFVGHYTIHTTSYIQ